MIGVAVTLISCSNQSQVAGNLSSVVNSGQSSSGPQPPTPTPVPTATQTPVPTPSPTPIPTPASSADFNTRCSDPNVVRCYGFDDPVDVQQYLRLGNTRGSDPNATIDTTIKASGNGSLRFTEPAIGGEGSPGNFHIPFSPNHLITFGPGQDFYIQWRQRFDLNFINSTRINPLASPTEKSNGFKQAIIADTTEAACSTNELVIQDVSDRGFPQLYQGCYLYNPMTVYDSQAHPGQYELQNAVSNPGCLWKSSGGPYSQPCTMYLPDQWMTFQIHVKVGTWDDTQTGKGPSNTIVQMWVAYEGQPSVLALDFSPTGDAHGFSFINDSGNEPYGYVWLLPFRTGEDCTASNPAQCPVDYTWYDELVISRSKIADPK